MRFILLFILLAVNLILYSQTDSLVLPEKKAQKIKDTIAWVSQDDKLIVGSEISQLHVNLDMDNIFNNATDSNIFRFRGLEHWKFTTSHDPSGISYYVNSRFGKFNFFTHKVPGVDQPGEFQSSFIGFGYGYQFKRIILNASYRKISGFVREDQYAKIKDTLKGMTSNDFRFAFQFTGLGSSQFNKYGFSQLYIPVKAAGYVNFKFETVLMSFRDKNGIVPYVSGYNWNAANANWDIHYDQDGYMQKFNLYVQSLYIHILGIIPIIKQKGERPKSLSLRVELDEGLDLYSYTISPGAGQIERSGLKFRAITNLYASASVVYCDRKIIVGTAIYFKANSFSADDEPSLNYYLRTVTGYIAFRIPFKKGYEKINDRTSRIFNKSKQ